MNIQEIDKWLDNEYGISYTRLEELHDYFFEKYTDQKEKIERLNKEIESWIKLINYNEIEDIPQYIEDLEVDNKSLKKENKEINKENKKLKLCLGIVSPSRVLLEGKYWEKDDNEEIERLKSIIKEVREYIEEKKYSFCDEHDLRCEDGKKILEILDKEN